jgi:hypothetical protein
MVMKKLLILLVLCSSCTLMIGEQYDPTSVLDARLSKGCHYSDNYPLMTIYTSDEIWRTVLFKSNCEYDLGNDNQGDTNKLFGIGKLGVVNFKSAHLQDSGRFGWRWDIKKHQMEIMAFSHVNGVMKFESMGFISLEEEVFLKLKIDWNNHCYIYRIIQDDILLKEYREKFTTNKYVRTELSLYFGGDETAPHNMNIIYKYQ